MFYRRLFLVAFVFAMVAGGSKPAIAGRLSRPPEVVSEHGVARLTLLVVHDPATNLPAYSYNGAFVPPTIRVNPGDHIKLTLVNDLPRESHGPFDNMTNLHFHGMKTSPNAPADDVVGISVMPGHRYEYDVPIPKDESPGLYFYHPHPHGESNRQVTGGMTGAIIVNGIEKYYPEVARVPERLLILRDSYPRGYPVPPAFAPARQIFPGKSGPVCTGPGSENLTLNGDPQPTIAIPPGQTQFWRVANTSANTFVDIAVDGAKLYVIARDGEPIIFRDRQAGGLAYTHFLLAPANRVEFFVTASTQPNAKLRSRCVDTGPLGDIAPDRVLASLVPGGEPGEALVPGPADLLPTHKPFADIRTYPIAAKKTIVLTEDKPNGLFYINGQLYDPAKPAEYFAKAGTVEQWTIINKTQELHAFHIHQIHFLVMMTASRNLLPLDFRDTVTVPYETNHRGHEIPGRVTLLMDFSDPIIKGTFVFHCHILEHEDGGMMQKITVR
jgi:FtsP/CotA-like multicopper oxidase with cupredoxin domain